MLWKIWGRRQKHLSFMQVNFSVHQAVSLLFPHSYSHTTLACEQAPHQGIGRNKIGKRSEPSVSRGKKNAGHARLASPADLFSPHAPLGSLFYICNGCIFFLSTENLFLKIFRTIFLPQKTFSCLRAKDWTILATTRNNFSGRSFLWGGVKHDRS